jgi:hypothetical protein
MNTGILLYQTGCSSIFEAFIKEHLSHFSAFWWAFGALMFLLEPKGRGGESCVGLF